VITPQQLLRSWRYVILGIVVLAAVITPSGDPISLAALAVPMTVLFFIAVLIGWLFQRRNRRQTASA
jgi:sec-independent protein translocase protein TatC